MQSFALYFVVYWGQISRTTGIYLKGLVALSMKIQLMNNVSDNKVISEGGSNFLDAVFESPDMNL